MSTYEGVDVHIYVFLISALVSGQLHASAGLPLDKNPPYPLDKRLGVPRACLDVAEKKEFLTSPGLEL
jgi:hypothetical protein